MSKARVAMAAALIVGTLVCNAAGQTAKERMPQSGETSLGDVSLGGYGELHYNNLSGKGGASDAKAIDFHRFVLFVGHDFTDRIRFASELELEHSLSGDGKPGEVELEQAYVDFDVKDVHTVRGGLFLLPIGILNETHEPNTFYGVERNAVEKNIIPTTWWEAGAGMYGQLAGDFSYAAYVHSGLMTSSNSSYAVRSGRQKGAKADASDLAGTVAVNWRIPGVTIGGAIQYQADITQSAETDAAAAVLGEVHADIRKGSLGLRALYSQWRVEGSGPDSQGSDKQYGWYFEPSYRPIDSVGVFARYNEWNNKAGSNGDKGRRVQYDIGINWWLHDQVVVKADYQWQDNADGKDKEGFNLGIGYAF